MKTLIALIFFSQFAYAQPIAGVIVSKKHSDAKIYLECVTQTNDVCKFARLVAESGGTKHVNEATQVPMGSEYDPYVERWTFFNNVATEASIRMPTVPEFRYLYLVNRSMAEYRKAFKAIDSGNEQFELKELYFEHLFEVVRDFH